MGLDGFTKHLDLSFAEVCDGGNAKNEIFHALVPYLENEVLLDSSSRIGPDGLHSMCPSF